MPFSSSQPFDFFFDQNSDSVVCAAAHKDEDGRQCDYKIYIGVIVKVFLKTTMMIAGDIDGIFENNHGDYRGVTIDSNGIHKNNHDDYRDDH